MNDETVPTVHGSVARVIDTPSQGVSYLRVEVPIEYHAELTRLFYGKRVLVVLAGDATKDTPFGIIGVPAEPKAATIKPAEKAAAPVGGPLSKSAATICDTIAFQHYAWARASGAAEPLPEGYGSGDAAAWLRQACGIKSRAELDHHPIGPAVTFRHIMHDFRQFVDSHPELMEAA